MVWGKTLRWFSLARAYKLAANCDVELKKLISLAYQLFYSVFRLISGRNYQQNSLLVPSYIESKI